ncbi:MAG: immunoglobulin domain-containing protein, partial [Janthinobacterium lividum]
MRSDRCEQIRWTTHSLLKVAEVQATTGKARGTYGWHSGQTPVRQWLVLALLLAGSVLNLTGCGGGWGEAAPKITAAIQGNAVNVGGTLILHASPTGTGPFTYQWLKNDVPLAGATVQTYTLTVQASDNGAIYTVQITNAAGTATSMPFVLNVGIAPTITVQPTDATVTAGQAATMTVAATGTSPMTYQWFRNSSLLSGATSASYTTPANAVTDSGAVFTVSVANAIGTVTSSSTTLTVTPLVPSLAFNPISSKTFGDPSFLVSATSASPGAVTYSVVSGPGTVSGAAVTVNGAGTLVLSASQAAAGNYAAATATTSVLVNPVTPALSFQPIASQTYGDPAFAVLAHSASPAPVTYVISSGPATISGSSVTSTGAGIVTIAASQAATANYNASTTSTSFNVGIATPILAFTPVLPHTFGDPAFAVLASSASPGLVTYTVDSGPARISGSSLTLTGAGTINLSASQAA